MHVASPPSTTDRSAKFCSYRSSDPRRRPDPAFVRPECPGAGGIRLDDHLSSGDPALVRRAGGIACDSTWSPASGSELSDDTKSTDVPNSTLT